MPISDCYLAEIPTLAADFNDVTREGSVATWTSEPLYVGQLAHIYDWLDACAGEYAGFIGRIQSIDGARVVVADSLVGWTANHQAAADALDPTT